MKPDKDTSKKKRETSNIVFDVGLLQALLKEDGKSFGSARTNEYGDVSGTTWWNISKGKAVRPDIAKAVAAYFGRPIASLEEGAAASDTGTFAWPELREWKYVRPLAKNWENTSNGLSFLRCQVRDEFVSTKENPVFGRARIYNLTGVSDEHRQEMAERLPRHPQASRELARFPHFVTNLAAAPLADGTVWWVVDEWFDATDLLHVLRKNAVQEPNLTVWMRQIAEGLQILTDHDFVMRELSPKRLLLTQDNQVRFTDLELVKILRGGETVSTEWPTDPYRAPEVANGKATPRADIFSWAMIYLHAATGDLTLGPRDLDAIDETKPNRKLKQLLASCLEGMPSKRPGSADELLAALD